MTAIPVVTVYVRHAADCRYRDDEAFRRCNCRKHLRWSQDGRQHRRAAGTRSWAEAERVKHQLEDELIGHAAPAAPVTRALDAACDLFLKDKRVQGVSEGVLGKYERLFDHLEGYAAGAKIHTIQGIASREFITGFLATWEARYPSTITRAKLRERFRSFLRYCYEAEWIPRVPAVPVIKIDEPETQPLTPEEYARLLAAVRPAVADGDPRRRTDRNNGRRSPDEEEAAYTRVRAFIQCMRWSGLAILDTLTLPRTSLTHDKARNLWKIETERAKTGTSVAVAIPASVAAEMVAAAKHNTNPDYFFWAGGGDPQRSASNWSSRYISPVFKRAGITSEGNMVSHRLRDTFAVHLLERGVPMEDVSRALGHKSIRITEKHYAKWSRGRQDRLDSLISGTWDGAVL